MSDGITERDPRVEPGDDEQASGATGGRRGTKLLLALLALIPLTAALEQSGARGSLLFVCAVLATVPLAGFIGRATEELSIRSTPALGGLLNATFGNAIELVISIRLLLGNPHGAAIVRASVVGSLATNLLLLIGLSMFAGGLKYKEQKFNSVAAGVSSSLLIIAFAGVAVPTVFGHSIGVASVPSLSHAVSIVMAFMYLSGIVFTFVTHRHLFDTTDELRGVRRPEWSVGRALSVLIGAILAAGYLAGVLARTLEAGGEELHLTKTFVGVIVLGAITNVAENLSAISYARRNLIDLSLQIGTSSTTQIMLFVVPILVFVGAITGRTFALDFSMFELACMLLPVLIINHLSADGVCNWLEGLQLIGLYAIVGIAFYFVP